ncbi:MAG TPA: zf-TFIIB domain-containing protein [Limnochordia bacterium]
MLCPACKVELRIADRSGIEIDYCPQCRGVWLDRGELDKIIERSMPRRFDDDDGGRGDSDEPHSYRKKKRRGFLGELFDFDFD